MKFWHGPFGVSFHNQSLEAGKGAYHCFNFFQWNAIAKIRWRKALPKTDGQRFGHVEGLLDESLVAEAAAEINHAHIKEVITLAEIAQVDEITLVADEDGVAVLEVAVYGRVLVGRIGDETGQFVFFNCCKKGILFQQAVVTILDILELRGIHVNRVEFEAHLGELIRKLCYLFGLVSCGMRIGLLAQDTLETDAVTAVFGHHIFTRLGCGDAHVIDFSGQFHFVQWLLDLAREIELQHHRGVGLVVVAFTVGTTAGKHIVVEGYFNGFH